jgi:hypothetical protein
MWSTTIFARLFVTAAIRSNNSLESLLKEFLVCDKFCRRNPKGESDFIQSVKCHVSLAPFNRADVGAVKATALCKSLL